MIDAIVAAVTSLLETDPVFVAAMQALGLGSLGAAAVPQVIEGNQPLASLGKEHFPAWVIELGDIDTDSLTEGNPEFLTIGSRYQGMAMDVPIALVWHQQQRATAFSQRTKLLKPVVQLFLRNNQPGGCSQAYVSGAIPDRAANHPLQVWAFNLRVEFVIARS